MLRLGDIMLHMPVPGWDSYLGQASPQSGAGLAFHAAMAELTAGIRATQPELRTTLAGIPLIVDRSWGLGLAITTVCCGLVMQLVAKDLAALPALGLGLTMALALSASLLLHELAHAYVAGRRGVGIEHIRLFVGGALCRRVRMADAPMDQFEVAVAGPAASAFLGLFFLILAISGGVLQAALPLTAILWFLSLVNLLVALSNLLPVFPFDGGKLVHSIFWRSGRDRLAASARLERSGREFSRIVTTLGLLLIAFGGEVLIGGVVAVFGLYLLRLPSPR